MIKTNQIIYKNNIQKKYLNSKNNKIFKKKFFNILKNIELNLNSTKDIFYSLSKEFKFNFALKDLNKFKNYKTVIIIGMGGSILGSEAIYSALKKKNKKKVHFYK